MKRWVLLAALTILGSTSALAEEPPKDGAAAPAEATKKEPAGSKPEPSKAPQAVEVAKPGDGKKSAAELQMEEEARKALRGLMNAQDPSSATKELALPAGQRKGFDSSMKNFGDDLGRQLTEFGKKVAEDIQRELAKQAGDGSAQKKIEETLVKLKEMKDAEAAKAAADKTTPGAKPQAPSPKGAEPAASTPTPEKAAEPATEKPAEKAADKAADKPAG